MTRGQKLLFAQRRGPSLGPPSEGLTPDECQAWHDIVAATHAVFHRQDRFCLEPLARLLAVWRAGLVDRREYTRHLYRGLGHCLVPMATRRRLLFPEARPSRSRLV